MDSKLLLVKSLTLLYRESQLADKTENSADLIRTVLDDIQVSDIGLGISSDRDVILALKSNILEMCNNPIDHEYSITELLQSIKVNTGIDDKLYEAIKQGIDEVIPDNQIKRSIVNLRKSINNHFKEQKISDILNKASQTFKFNRSQIKDVNHFVMEIITQLEPLQLSNSSKDPAIISDVDIGNDESLRDAFGKVKSSTSGDRVYKTGSQGLNLMLQGGLRPGEFVMTPALQHKYKTGQNLTLFSDIARFNEPLTTDSNKKPLMLRISFEDSLNNNLQFLYQYLRYDETREYVDIKNIDSVEMSDYVKKKLQVNGFHIKMIRVDPDQWTYKSIFNKIIELEAQGYKIECLFLDYLSKIPTIGCSGGTVPGSELLSLFSKVRNFCAGKDILCVTPHQLSTEAKSLIRGGMPEDQFPKEIAGKGYYERCRSLDTIYDVCIIQHLFKHDKQTYLALQLDKHRISTVLSDDDYKYMILPFPKQMPIPSDLNREPGFFRTLAEAKKSIKGLGSNNNDDIFSLG